MPVHNKIIWHGGHGENENQQHLTAGRLSMLYENGSIRHICLGSHEIIRRIYMAVRDRHWLTIKPVISNEQVIKKTDSFIIKFCYEFISADINFSARLTIEGGSDSSLSMRFRGMSHSSFEKNRIGFCVLHPVRDVAGKDCLIENPGGELSICKFPDSVSPHQPFTDITLMQWNIAGISCRLDFYGDIFETEDQRNWTDASFKTYAPPLKIHYPVAVGKGENQYQKIVLKIQPGNSEDASRHKKIKSIKVFPEKSMPLPMIGVGRSSRTEPLTEGEVSVIHQAGFSHYRADIYLFREDWGRIADQAVAEADTLDCQLELALFFDDNYQAQIQSFISRATAYSRKIAVLLLFHKNYKYTPQTLGHELIPLLRMALPGSRIAAGTNANFAQVNRNRPENLDNDLVCYSIHPQEHASDNLTLTENIEGQGYTVETALSFSSGKEIWVSPVNFVRRFNGNIENFESPSPDTRFPMQADSRVMSLFGACWIAGSIKQLSESGASGITYLETAGERGIIQGNFPSRWPGDFPSEKGMIFPLYHVFRFVSTSRAFKIWKCISDDPLSTEALVMSDGRNIKFIIINYSASAQEVVIEGITGKYILRQLFEDTFPESAGDPGWIGNAGGKKITAEKKIHLPRYSLSFGEGTTL